MSGSRKARFITFEGIEGSGKSTHVDLAGEYLKAKGIDFVTTHEPGRTELGMEIRELLLKHRDEPVSPLAELFLLFASRSQLLSRVIQPALESGQWVLCDRFADSSIAYQGGGRGLGIRCVEQLIEGMGDTYIEPDLTFLLDIDSAESRPRITHRLLDRIESEDLDFFERARQTYLDQAEKSDRIQVIDASPPIERVRVAINERLDVLLDNN